MISHGLQRRACSETRDFDAGSLSALVICRLVMGLGEGVTFPCIQNLVASDVPEQNKAQSLAAIYSGVQVLPTLPPSPTTPPLPSAQIAQTFSVLATLLPLHHSITATDTRGTGIAQRLQAPCMLASCNKTQSISTASSACTNTVQCLACCNMDQSPPPSISTASVFRRTAALGSTSPLPRPHAQPRVPRPLPPHAEQPVASAPCACFPRSMYTPRRPMSVTAGTCHRALAPSCATQQHSIASAA